MGSSQQKTKGGDEKMNITHDKDRICKTCEFENASVKTRKDCYDPNSTFTCSNWKQKKNEAMKR